MPARIFKGGEFLVTEVACEEIFTPEEFTDEQKQIGETTEQFVTNEILPHLEEIDNQNFDLVVEGMSKCGELGLLMLDAPEEYGCLELDKVTSMLVTEKLAFSLNFGGVFSRCLLGHQIKFVEQRKASLVRDSVSGIEAC